MVARKTRFRLFSTGYLNSFLDLAKRIRLKIERASAIGEMAMKSAGKPDIMISSGNSLLTSQFRTYVMFNNDWVMRNDEPKNANRNRFLFRAWTPPIRAITLSIMIATRFGKRDKKS